MSEVKRTKKNTYAPFVKLMIAKDKKLKTNFVPKGLNTNSKKKHLENFFNTMETKFNLMDVVVKTANQNKFLSNLQRQRKEEKSTRAKKQNFNLPRKSSFDDSEIEQNVVAFILNLFRHLFHNNDILQDRLERNNGIALLSFLLQRLPKRFIDVNLLRMCQEFVNEANLLSNKDLLNLIYEHLIFLYLYVVYLLEVSFLEYLILIIYN